MYWRLLQKIFVGQDRIGVQVLCFALSHSFLFALRPSSWCQGVDTTACFRVEFCTLSQIRRTVKNCHRRKWPLVGMGQTQPLVSPRSLPAWPTLGRYGMVTYESQA